MATRWVEVDTTPAALPGQIAEQAYTLQNVTPDAVCFVALATSVPSRGAPAFQLAPGELGTAQAAAGETIYAWCGSRTARLAMDEAP